MATAKLDVPQHSPSLNHFVKAITATMGVQSDNVNETAGMAGLWLKTNRKKIRYQLLKGPALA